MVARRILLGGTGRFPLGPDSVLYALYNGTTTGQNYSIGAASKAIGGSWTVYGSNPVMSPGAAGAWDDETVKDPWLMYDGSQYVCYFAGYDGANYRIGRATAPAYTGPWTKSASNPVITLGSSGAFDDVDVMFPTVLYEPTDTGREWKMWFGAYDGAKHRIGYAYSSDGVTWTKHGQVLDVGAAGTWEDEGILPGAIFKDGGTHHLFYAGRQGTTNPRWQGGVATFTDPAGTYTKSGSNPILLARFNDAGTAQSLSGTVGAGTSIVTVAGSTSAFNVGEAMVLADANSETEVHEIASIDSGTQLTLGSVTTAAFAGTDGGVIRPLAFNAVLPRTVRAAYGGGFEMFGTPFQPVSDLSPGGSPLREGSLRWTAATALTGPWAYDYSTGLMFPLYPANSGWDKFSAENPSVIAAP